MDEDRLHADLSSDEAGDDTRPGGSPAGETGVRGPRKRRQMIAKAARARPPRPARAAAGRGCGRSRCGKTAVTLASAGDRNGVLAHGLPLARRALSTLDAPPVRVRRGRRSALRDGPRFLGRWAAGGGTGDRAVSPRNSSSAVSNPGIVTREYLGRSAWRRGDRLAVLGSGEHETTARASPARPVRPMRWT